MIDSFYLSGDVMKRLSAGFKRRGIPVEDLRFLAITLWISKTQLADLAN